MRRLTTFFACLLLLLGLAGVVSGIRPLAAQDAATASPATCAATSLEENKAVARRYFSEVWRTGGERVVAEVLAPDELHHWGLGNDTIGSAAFTERLTGFLTAFPDLQVENELVVAEGELVVIQYTATGTQQGAFFGIEPTNVEAEWSGIQFFRIECGLIAESWGEADHLGLRQQLGLLLTPGTPVAIE